MNTPEPNTPAPADSNRPSLYDLYCLFRQAKAADVRREILEAIVEHDELKLKLRFAACKVFRRCRTQPEMCAELMQQTRCLLVELLSRHDLAYSDFGSENFSGWLWRVVLTATDRAWRHCRPFWVKRKLSTVQRPLQPASCGADAADDGENLRAAIARIPDVLTREIIDEFKRGIARAESARLHNVSEATIRKHRQLGFAELRRILSDR